MQARTYRNHGCGTWASPHNQSTSPCRALREYDAYIKTALSFPDRQVCGPSFRGPVCAQRRIGHARFASMPNACLGLVAAARPCACFHGQADAHRPCFASTVAILDPKQVTRITIVMAICSCVLPRLSQKPPKQPGFTLRCFTMPRREQLVQCQPIIASCSAQWIIQELEPACLATNKEGPTRI